MNKTEKLPFYNIKKLVPKPSISRDIATINILYTKCHLNENLTRLTDFHTETSTNQIALFDYDCTIFLLVKDRLVPKPLLYHVT